MAALPLPLPLPGFVLASPPGQLLTRLLERPLSSFTVVTALLLVAELALNVLIVKKVPYTEIDWVAYVDEVEGVLVRPRCCLSSPRPRGEPVQDHLACC